MAWMAATGLKQILDLTCILHPPVAPVAYQNRYGSRRFFLYTLIAEFQIKIWVQRGSSTGTRR